MNEEKYVIAQLKRWLVKTANGLAHEYDNVGDVLNKVLHQLAVYESDAILGTTELIDEYLDKLPGGDADCDACKIEFTEVQNG